MKLIVFSIFDEKGSMFGVPFFMSAKGLALRGFQDLVNDKNSSVSKHPGDYKLYSLATYDDCTGRFESHDIPEFIANAVDFVDSK